MSPHTWPERSEPWLRVLGCGVVLPAATHLGHLAGLLSAGRPAAAEPRWFDAPGTDLAPVEIPVAVCRSEPEGVPRSDGVPRESLLAVRAAAAALPAAPPLSRDPQGAETMGVVGTVWASSTAGLAEYGRMCVDVATLAPGLTSPLLGPQAALNGPASAVSLRHRLAGPLLALTGGAEAGAGALFEAGRLLAAGECDEILVGASAEVSRWRLAGPAGSLLVPAEGAVCLRLGRWPGAASESGPSGAAVAVRGVLRARLCSAPTFATPARAAGCATGVAHPGAGHGAAGEGRRLDGPAVDEAALGQFVKDAAARLSAPPGLAVLSAPPTAAPAAVDAMRAAAPECRHVERVVGDVAAAGGLVATAVAVAVAAAATPPAAVLVVALGPTGDAVAVEAAARWKEDPTWN